MYLIDAQLNSRKSYIEAPGPFFRRSVLQPHAADQMAATALSALLGGGGSGAGIGASVEPPSASATILLSAYRTHLLEIFTHFCGASSNLTHGGWMAFADAFDICPGYLSSDRLEEAFDEAAKGRAATASAWSCTRRFSWGKVDRSCVKHATDR